MQINRNTTGGTVVGKGIFAVPTIERIVAGTAINQVIASPAANDIASGTTRYDVITSPGRDGIGVGATCDGVVKIRRNNLLDIAQDVRAGIRTSRDIVGKADIHPRLGITEIDDVRTGTTDIGIITCFADECIVACTAIQHIIARTTGQRIVPRTAR